MATADTPNNPVPPDPNAPSDSNPPTAGTAAPPPAHPMRSICSSNLAEILKKGNCSLLVTTYQAGKVILVREDNGTVNTHFRGFRRPTGVAFRRDRLAIGAQSTIWTFDNIPEVSPRLDPPNRSDACYMTRDIHFTGFTDTHEMAYGADGQLWFINTRFSCLCNLEGIFSFVPRWRPHFISALAPEDRCHLNGMGMVNGKPKYVTALGEADTNQGWRENKVKGGILMDVDSNQVLMRGLCMPHSPRLYNDKVWILESGAGKIGYTDLNFNKFETVCELPGFTRGFDIYGGLAFVGLSQVRETATFGGLPLVERLKQEERWSGVAVVDLVSGKMVAFLRFEDAVQEIFAVQVMPGLRFPDLVNDNDQLLGTSYRLP